MMPRTTPARHRREESVVLGLLSANLNGGPPALLGADNDGSGGDMPGKLWDGGPEAETREHAREAVQQFTAEYGAKYPKAVTTLEQDADALFTFFDFPAEHWKHLRT